MSSHHRVTISHSFFFYSSPLKGPALCSLLPCASLHCVPSLAASEQPASESPLLHSSSPCPRLASPARCRTLDLLPLPSVYQSNLASLSSLRPFLCGSLYKLGFVCLLFNLIPVCLSEIVLGAFVTLCSGCKCYLKSSL